MTTPGRSPSRCWTGRPPAAPARRGWTCCCSSPRSPCPRTARCAPKPGGAIALQRRAIAAHPGSAPLVAPLVEHLEAAHRFAAAAATARALRGMAGAFPRGAGLYPLLTDGELPTLTTGAARGPLSLG